MGMITAACFSINPIGKTGAIVLMLSHGLTRSALFALMSYLYERHKSRLIKNYQGIRQTTPILSTILIIISILIRKSLPKLFTHRTETIYLFIPNNNNTIFNLLYFKINNFLYNV